MKNTKTVQFDNIATAGAPVWRGRFCKPLTCYAVRIELVRQAAELPEYEQHRYLDERLTDLDRALTDNEAVAVESWLDCEEMLQGRAKTTDYNGSGGGGFGPSSPIASDAMEALEGHAEMKSALCLGHRRALHELGLMMDARDWRLGTPFIQEIKSAARVLEKLRLRHHGA